MVSTADVPAAKRQRSDVQDVDEAMVDAPAAPPTPGTQPEAGMDFTGLPVHDLMRLYYSRLFPHQDFFRWLAYGNDGKHPGADPAAFQRREFCFTLDNDIFVRYQSFKNGAELASALCARLPAKIDIGPVYSVDPQQRKTLGDGKFYPVSRELVFDIDLTDYDDVRTCGSGGHICNSCWPLMAVAIQVLDRGLREDFGFQHILWVFSGRRGVHCWVCDRRARCMTDEQRSALAAYFALYKGQEEGMAKMFLSATDHPFVASAYALLDAAWHETVLPGQRLLEHADQQEAILRYIPCEETRVAVRAEWDRRRPDPTDDVNLDRWAALQRVCEAASAKNKGDKGAESRVKTDVRAAPKRIVLAYTFPRLDIEVSKKMNHLLKAPFCIHPKTGKVCVPLDPRTSDSFDPLTVPTVGSLLNELNAKAAGEQTAETAKGEEWTQTAMAHSVEVFRDTFLTGLCKATKAEVEGRPKGGRTSDAAW